MKTKPRFQKTILLMLALFMTGLWSCNQSSSKIERPADYYVTSHTTGVIPANSVINARLAFPVAESLPLNQPLKEGVFDISPRISGKVFLVSRQTIRFIPDEPLTNGKSYEARLNLSKLYPDEDVSFPKVEFSFDIIELDFTLGDINLIPYNNNSLEWNKLEGSIIASDVIDPHHLQNWLDATLNGKSLSVIWDKTSLPPIYSFTIDSIERTRVPQSVQLTWKTPSSGKAHNSTNFEVPTLKEFKLLTVSTESAPDQTVILTFTDPLNPRQSFDGLVFFKDQSPISLSVENNTIRVIPKNRMTADQTLVIATGIENSMGSKLVDYEEKVVHFEPALPEVKFTGKGSILPGNDRWNIPFEIRNLTAVDVTISKIFPQNILQFLQVNSFDGDYEMYRVGEKIYQGKYTLEGAPKSNTWDYSAYALDLTKLINTEPGAIYQIELSFARDDVIYPCEDDPNDDDGYYWRNRNNPCKQAFYYSYNDHFATKNILASNLGVTVKNNGANLNVWVNNILTTKPEAQVQIQVYGFQKQLLAQSITNGEGMAMIALPRESSPGFLVATKGKESAYLKIDDGQALSYAKFDTRGRSRQGSLQGYLYGERGVWRPGDTLFLTLIVEDKSGKLPDNHPVTMELTNPKGKVVQTKTVSTGENGFYTFAMTTSSDAETGLYYATAKMGNALFTKPLRIENIKPNRLKIELSFADSLLSKKNDQGEIISRWLSGGPASGFEAVVEATFKPKATHFDGYYGYHFSSPSRNFYPETKTVFSGKLNEEGHADFDINLPSATNAPGMIGVSFFTKVMEKGGDFSVNQKRMTYSPFSTYVGVKSPEVPKGADYLEVDKPVEFEVATVNELGNPVSVKGLEVSVYKLSWSWWYGNGGGSNLAGYLNSHYNDKILSQTIDSKDGKAQFSVDLHYPSWGWYYAEISDPRGGHATGVKFYMDWPSYYSRDQREAPGDVSHLSVSTDREKYEVGDSVYLTMELPPNARLQVSIESADTILQSWQQTAGKKEMVVSFVATDRMVPNVYASVRVLQPYSQSVNDLPVRMYGLANITVDNPESVLVPTIESPESIKPNSDYTIRVTEKNQRKMTYTLAVVDDGLLDLTNFKTPDPHAWFFAKEALAIKTWDDYDEILGAFGGRILNTIAVGGDGSEEDQENGDKKANRFKPVVTFMGPFTLNAGQEDLHTLHMPNYIGSVRVMVVAADKNSFGAKHKTLTVKQPLMVLATVPRVLCPGETINMPVSVFAMEDQIKEVQVKVTTNDFFRCDSPQKNLTFKKQGEQLAWIELKVNDLQGLGTIHVEVSSGNQSAYYDVELQVRNPNPVVTITQHHRLLPGADSTYQPPSVGLPDTRKLEVTFSGIFPINLEKRLGYLSRYPYGCSEQVVSAVFPQLFLERFTTLTKTQKENLARNMMSALTKLGQRQQSSGGFVYWPGQYQANDWITSYVGNFIVLAMDQGYPVSQTMVDKWIKYQTSMANSWMSERFMKGYTGDANQAYRLYTLALAHRPALGAMNRMSELKDLSSQALVHLAAAYALAGQTEMAKNLLKRITPDRERYPYAYSDGYGSDVRDQSFLLMTYLLLDDQNTAFILFERLAKELGSPDWLSTQTTAFALYAVAQFVGNQPADTPLKYAYIHGKYQSGNQTTPNVLVTDSLDASTEVPVQVFNKSTKDLFVTFTASGIPEPAGEIHVEDNLWLDLTYYDMDNHAINPTKLTQGQDFYVKVTVRNSRLFGKVENMALSVNLPSGWEIINTRLFDVGTSFKNSRYDYLDIKDDGVDVFFDLASSEVKEFFVLLHATYAGTYIMPTTGCEAMYNNQIKAARGGGWVSVVKRN